MDIALQTNDPQHTVELLDIRPARDHDGFGSVLRIRSGGFAAETPFQIERECLEQFGEQLREMDRTLTGTALLQPFCELDQVSLTLTRTGSVVVTGELGSLGFNYLKFHFTTDQTCLRPLVSAVEQVLVRRNVPVV